MRMLHTATAHRPLTAVKEPAARTGEGSGLLASHAAQAICDAANDLLDCALNVESLDDAIELARVVRMLRERMDAIANRTLQRMDELCAEGE